jgi:hypothetical protein
MAAAVAPQMRERDMRTRMAAASGDLLNATGYAVLFR